MFPTLRSRRTAASVTSKQLTEKLIDNEVSKVGVVSRNVHYVIFFCVLFAVFFCVGFLFGSRKLQSTEETKATQGSLGRTLSPSSATIWNEKRHSAPQLSTEPAVERRDTVKSSLVFDSSPVYQGRPWDDIAHQVAVAVKTGKSVSKERIPKHNETWWKRIPNLLLISDVKEDEFNSVGLKEMYELLPKNLSKFLGLEQLEATESDVEKQPSFFGEMTEGFKMDSKKNLPGFFALYNKFPDKKWYIMLDDDTFVFLDNLALTLQMDHFRLLAEEQPFYLGNPFTVSDCDKYGEFFDEDGNPNPSFAHGGSGIVLSKAAMEKIAPHIPWCIKRWDICKEGDARVGLCLLSFQILLTDQQPFFYHETPMKYFEEYASLSNNRQAKPEALPVTFHHVKGQLVDQMLELEKEAVAKQWLVTYADLAKAFAPMDFEFV